MLFPSKIRTAFAVLALLFASAGQAQTWQKIGSPEPANGSLTWKKVGCASGSAGTWQKVGGCGITPGGGYKALMLVHAGKTLSCRTADSNGCDGPCHIPVDITVSVASDGLITVVQSPIYGYPPRTSEGTSAVVSNPYENLSRILEITTTGIDLLPGSGQNSLMLDGSCRNRYWT